MYLPTIKEITMVDVGYDLSQMFESIEEMILESEAGREYMVWLAVEGACSKLGIVVPNENNADDVEDADAEFVARARAEYGAVVEEFEGIVRSFYETSDELELLKKVRKISFFY
jgi:hypothetical protein